MKLFGKTMHFNKVRENIQLKPINQVKIKRPIIWGLKANNMLGKGRWNLVKSIIPYRGLLRAPVVWLEGMADCLWSLLFIFVHSHGPYFLKMHTFSASFHLFHTFAAFFLVFHTFSASYLKKCTVLQISQSM